MHLHLLSLVALTSLSFAQASAPAADPRPWTFLIYGAADNNCDGPIFKHIEQVSSALDDDPGVEVLLFLDRHAKHSESAAMLDGNFTGCRLYRVRKGSTERLAGGAQFPALTTTADAELDSADATTLKSFVAWGKATAPARRYGLIIYGHADGASMCPDDDSGHEMGFAELTDETTAAEAVDFLALELCAMGGIEVSYQWRPGQDHFGADVMLAIPNAGPPLDWDRIFARVRSRGHAATVEEACLDPTTMSAADFGRMAIEEARRGRELSSRNAQHEAAGCYDLREAANVKRAVDALAVALAKTDAREPFLALRDGSRQGAAIQYGEDFFVDLYDLARMAAACDVLTEDARRAAQQLLAPLDRFVLASFGMSGYEGFEPGKCGVFIVLPPTNAKDWDGLAMYTPLAGQGSAYGRWAFLTDGATAGDGKVENWFELVDAWFDRADDSGGANGYRW
jgi:clostripain